MYQGEPGLLSNIQAVELSFSGWGAASGTASLAFQAQDEETMLQILAPVLHFSMYAAPPSSAIGAGRNAVVIHGRARQCSLLLISVPRQHPLKIDTEQQGTFFAVFGIFPGLS